MRSCTRPRLHGALALTVAIFAAGTTNASAEPRIAEGWPVMAVSGEVRPAPGGGLFAVGETDNFDWILSRYARSGTRLDESEARRSCGNCDPHWEDYWSLSRAGVGPSCVGDVQPDGLCVGFHGEGQSFALRATRQGRELWSVPLPRSSDVSPNGFDPPPEPTVRDGAGISYARVWTPDPPTDLINRKPALISVSRTGRIRPTQGMQAGRVVAGLRRGVVTFEEGVGLRALTPHGAERWVVAIRGADDRDAPTVISDPARNRLYVYEQPTRRVHAIDVATGETRWTRRAGGGLGRNRPRAGLLWVGRTGTVYLSRNDGPGPYALRALSPAGKLLWQKRTIMPVYGAAEIRDGRVAVSTGRPEAAFEPSGVLTLLNPRRDQASVPRSRARLSRGVPSRERPRGRNRTSFDRAERTVLRLDLQRGSRISTRIVDARGRTVRDSRATFRGPAGTSFVTLRPFVPTPGAYRLEVRWQDQRRQAVVRLPFRVID